MHSTPEMRWHWYCRIAHQGHGGASSKIGLMYRWGHEPYPEDQVQAYKWYSIAAREGHSPSASSLAWIERNMTPDEVLKAERLAAEWKPNPDECDVFLKANAEAQ